MSRSPGSVEPFHREVEFLRAAWSVIFQTRSGLVSKWALLPFIPASLFDGLSKVVRLDEVIAKSQSENAIAEALDETIRTLERDWNKLRAETKRDLIAYAEQHEMRQRFAHTLDLGAEDIEALKIRWDISDIVYADVKRRASKEFELLGLDVKKPEFNFIRDRLLYEETIAEIKNIFIKLIAAKVEVDMAVVIAAVRETKYKYVDEVRSRGQQEYLLLLTKIRKALREAYVRYANPSDDERGITELNASYDVENLLDPWKDTFDIYFSGIDNVYPTPEVFDQVRKLTAEDKMSVTYNIRGDGTVVNNQGTVVATINKGLAADKASGLAEAFALLKAEIHDMPRLREVSKRSATRAVEDAEDEAAEKKPRESKIEDDLKRAKSILEESGELFDSASGWGPRLVEVAGALMRSIPAAWSWLHGLVS